MKVYCLVRFPCRPIAYPSGTLTLSLLLDRGVGQILSFLFPLNTNASRVIPCFAFYATGMAVAAAKRVEASALHCLVPK